MFKVGDYLIYRKDVCKVKNIVNKQGIEYYHLAPIDDESLKIEVPLENSDSILKPIMSRQEIDNLIKEMPNIEIIDTTDKLIEYEYKQLLATGIKEDMVKVIKTAYLRIQVRINNKKKASEKDTNYLEKAERLLYNEFSVVLNLTFDETKQYIIDKVSEVVG